MGACWRGSGGGSFPRRRHCCLWALLAQHSKGQRPRWRRGRSHPEMMSEVGARPTPGLRLEEASAMEPLLSDEQWAGIAPLLPPRKSRGRPRADDRQSLEGIL